MPHVGSKPFSRSASMTTLAAQLPAGRSGSVMAPSTTVVVTERRVPDPLQRVT
jgi:hypothetical protein